MKRSILLTFIAALALAVGFSSVAQASAKKGKGKGKGAASGLPLKTGTYDGKNFELIVKGKKASLAYSPPIGGNQSCVPLPVEIEAQSVTSTATSFKASATTENPIFAVKWTITVQPSLSYKLVIDSSSGGPEVDPCDKPGVVITGKLTKESAKTSAAASGTKGKGKGKGCKAKKGKGKAKGKSSALASAKGKAKGKGKGKSCKGKAKGGNDGKADKPAPKPAPLPAPPAPLPPPPPPPSSWPLSDGEYWGQDGIGLSVIAGGTQAALLYVPDDAESTCIPFTLELPEEPVAATATSFKAGGAPLEFFGGFGEITWTIDVAPNLGYKAVIDSSLEFPETTPCNKPGVEFNGTLAKAG